MWYRSDDISVFLLDINEEIKVLELLRNSDGIDLKEIHIDDIPYYALIAEIRDFQKRGLTKNIDGILGITEHGIEYLNQLLNSNGDTTGKS
jgi:hypothetical protein